MSFKQECLDALKGEFEEIASKGQSIMKSYVVQTCNKGFATGSLAGSITKVQESEFGWKVGSPLDYASYVDEGRDEVWPVRKPALYLKGLNFWMPPGEPVGPADAKHFVEKTKSAIEGM